LITAATKCWGGKRGWRTAIWLVAIAFTLQFCIAQTHIHDSATAIHETASSSHGKSPIDNSPMDCPLCQAVANGSAFFLPASALVLLPAVCVELSAPILRLRVAFDVAAHNWKSRAPPKA
jgi:hypothetical protein